MTDPRKRKSNKLARRAPIGIETPLAGRPSHTTEHTGPYPAIRLVKTGTDNPIPILPAGRYSSTTLPAFQPLLHDAGKNMLFDNHDIHPSHSAGHRSGFRRGEASV